MPLECYVYQILFPLFMLLQQATEENVSVSWPAWRDTAS